MQNLAYRVLKMQNLALNMNQILSEKLKKEYKNDNERKFKIEKVRERMKVVSFQF